jgi:hypothetical protein
MIEKYDLSFLNIDKIKNFLLSIQGDVHGLLTDGRSTYNCGVPILLYPELNGLRVTIEKYIEIYCKKYNISKLKLINSWFNITNPGNELKPHNHDDGKNTLSGAFYVFANKNNVPLIFPDQEVQPYSGLLVIFSSKLVHHTKKENQQRIVISFNTDYL